MSFSLFIDNTDSSVALRVGEWGHITPHESLMNAAKDLIYILRGSDEYDLGSNDAILQSMPIGKQIMIDLNGLPLSFIVAKLCDMDGVAMELGLLLDEVQ